jgi:hypothetical protein
MSQRIAMGTLVSIEEVALTGSVQGVLLMPEPAIGLGVVVLAGSSGKIDVERARLFAKLGAVAIALRWFGGEGQTPGICEVPLETFTLATDKLVEMGCTRAAYVGTSKGAEAALLTAVYDCRVDIVVAISPTSVVWANTHAGADDMELPHRSSWTYDGRPLPFIAYDTEWKPSKRDGLISWRGLYEQSLRTFAADLPAAAIQVEKARAQMLLVAGGDDALWPSDVFANAIAGRLTSAGKAAFVIGDPEAGHRVLLPGEMTSRSVQHAHGGNDEADLRLGLAAWQAILRLLGLP